MFYPIVIHKEPGSCYGVTVPDLPGCHSAGDTIDEALVMAREAILGHLEARIENGMSLPAAESIEHHRANPDYRDAEAWALVDVDLASLPSKAVRINISIQQRVLAVVDEVARQEGDTRSGLLQRAATEYIDRSGVKVRTKRTLRRTTAKPNKRQQRTARP